MSALHHLAYVSQARIDACGPELRKILEVARKRNVESGITGLLLYTGDHFAQLLEGPAPALATLMTSIHADLRHNILHEWRACPISHRRHGHWALRYVYDDTVESWLAGLGHKNLSEVSIDEAVTHLFSHADFC